MCGRVVQSRPLDELEEAYDAPADDTARAALRPRYNVAPTDPLATIVEEAPGRRRLTAQRWGLLPPMPRRTKNPLINARAETIRVNPLFRAALERRRCLVPVDGFYEWQRLPDRRQPYFIRPVHGGPLTLAGIWAPWGEAPDGSVVGTCSIVTTTPLAEISWLHDRMPLILPVTRLQASGRSLPRPLLFPRRNTRPGCRAFDGGKECWTKHGGTRGGDGASEREAIRDLVSRLSNATNRRERSKGGTREFREADEARLRYRHILLDDELFERFIGTDGERPMNGSQARTSKRQRESAKRR